MLGDGDVEYTDPETGHQMRVVQAKIPELLTWITPASTIGAYNLLVKFTKGTKGLLQAHHIVEARHLVKHGLSVLKAPAIVLTKFQHQQVTNTLRKLLPYGKTYSKEQIINPSCSKC